MNNHDFEKGIRVLLLTTGINTTRAAVCSLTNLGIIRPVENVNRLFLISRSSKSLVLQIYACLQALLDPQHHAFVLGLYLDGGLKYGMNAPSSDISENGTRVSDNSYPALWSVWRQSTGKCLGDVFLVFSGNKCYPSMLCINTYTAKFTRFL